MKISNLHKVCVALAVEALIIICFFHLTNNDPNVGIYSVARGAKKYWNTKDVIDIIPTYHYSNFSSFMEASDTGYIKHIFQEQNGYGLNKSETLILASVANKDAFGGTRNLPDFLQTLHSVNYDSHKITLAIYFKEQFMLNEALFYFHHLFSTKASKNFNRVVLVHSTYVDDATEVSREDRHSDEAQKARRRAIARSRNFLYNIASDDELYTLHIDTDVTVIPSDLLNAAIISEKAIIVPRVILGGNRDYDKNSWSGPRTKPTEEDFTRLDNQEPGYFYVPRPTEQTKFLSDSIDPEMDENSERAYSYLVPLDSVGGAVLFVRSVVFQIGAQFPAFLLIGSDWSRPEGYDGIETEGLCYMAKISGGYEFLREKNQSELWYIINSIKQTCGKSRSRSPEVNHNLGGRVRNGFVYTSRFQDTKKS